MAQGLRMNHPSSRYSEGLPFGNGRLGGLMLGGLQEKFIHINEETCWYGGPRDRINPDALANMPKIRQFMREGRVSEAEDLAVLALTGTPESQRHFTTMGIISLYFYDHRADAENYHHTLDFSTATVSQQYAMQGAEYTVEAFASAPGQVIVIRVTADKPVLNFFAGIERGERVAQFSYGTHEDESRKTGSHGVLVSGALGGAKGLDFAIAMLGQCDGELSRIGDKILVRGASSAELYIAAGTNYTGEDPAAACEERAGKALRAGYAAVREAHLATWQPLYRAAGVRSVAAAAGSGFVDAEALFRTLSGEGRESGGEQAGDGTVSNLLLPLLFNYGRYLLLCASYDSLLPAALQGLWCRDLLSIWDGKYTTNINLQMNYWPVDSANIPGCFSSYFDFIRRVRESGRETAERMYGCGGFVLHNNSDIWADTAVQDSGTHCSYWFSGGFWLANDLWEHYEFTRDRGFLEEAWPILADAARFAMDFMERDAEGKWVMGVTTSPENFYIDGKGQKVSFCRMTAMDSQLIGLLFRNCLEALKVLPKDACAPEFAEQLEEGLLQLFPTVVSDDGLILEWGRDCREAEPNHRHLSHLIGAFPYHYINSGTPGLLKAVEKSLDKRRKAGGCNTGWGRAWAGGLYARLGRGDDARDMLMDFVSKSCQPNLFGCCNIGRAPKLMEDAMPMQLEGNMGVVSAVAEMLVQSHEDEIALLPALPSDWASGSCFGLKARGNIEIDMEWEGRELKSATLKPRVGGDVRLRVNGDISLMDRPFPHRMEGKGQISFLAEAGKEYRLSR